MSGPCPEQRIAYPPNRQRMQMRSVARSACRTWLLAAAAVSCDSAVRECAVAPEIATSIIDTNVSALIVIS